MKKLQLNFRGYWRESNKSYIPNAPGIYCVYAAGYDFLSLRTLTRRLLYIGESLGVRTQIEAHPLKTVWEQHLRRGEELCYTYAPIYFHRHRAHAALLYRHLPVENEELPVEFSYRHTELVLTGETAFLESEFSVPEIDLARKWPVYQLIDYLRSG